MFTYRSRNKEKPALGLVEFLDMVSPTLVSLNLWHIKLQEIIMVVCKLNV